MRPEKTLDTLRAGRWSQAVEDTPPELVFRSPLKTGEDFLPVLARGGIGDLFITIGFLAQLQLELGEMCIHLYTAHPDVADLILDSWDPIMSNAAKPQIIVQREPFPGFDYYLCVNALAVFHFQRNFKQLKLQCIEDLYLKYMLFANQGLWWKLIAAHPQLDNEVGRQALALGLTRSTLPYASVGISLAPKPYRLDLRAGQYDWEPFITVHDGYDTSQPTQHRATKTWSIRHWKDFIQRLRDEHPAVMIIQLGGPTSRNIPGVDVNLAGQIPIEESLTILSKSMLHIDGDSGLVHAARHLGVKSVVLFGPTPADFFGYPENVNLTPIFCGGCWWLTKEWLQACPLDYRAPECMNSIHPGLVFATVSDLLKDKCGCPNYMFLGEE